MSEKGKQPCAESHNTKLERYPQEKVLRQSNTILQAIALAAERFLRTDHLAQGITEVLAELGQTTGADRVYIFQNHRDSEELLTSQRYEWTAPGVEPQIDNPERQNLSLTKAGFYRWVEQLRANQTLYGYAQDFPPDERKVLAAQKIQSILVVPIFVRAGWWGFIGFDNYHVKKSPTPHSSVNGATAEIDALKTAARIIGAALENSQLHRETQSRAQQLAALHEVSYAIGNTLDTNEISHLALEQSCEMFNAPMGTVYLADLLNDVAILQVTVGLTQPEATRTSRLPLRDSLTGQVIITGRPLFIEQGMPLDPTLVGQSQAQAQSAAFVPLAVGEHVLGTLNLIFDYPRAFSPDEQTLLLAIGRQVGMALANAHLFQKILAAERETNRRAEQLAALHEIDQAITSTLEPEAVYACIVEQAAGLLDCQAAILFLWDQTSAQATSVTDFTKSVTSPAIISNQNISGQRLDADQSPIIREMLDTQEPVAIADAKRDPRVSPSWRQQLDARALLALPLVSREQVIGFLYLVDQVGSRQWRPDEIAIAGQLATQTAIAIQNARLFETEHKTRQTAEALQEIARIVNAGLDLNHTLNLLLEQLTRLLPYDSATVFMRKGEQLCAAAARGFSDQEQVLQLTVSLTDDTLMLQTIESGKPLMLTDAQQDDRFQKWAVSNHVRGWIGVPLLVGAELVGILTIDSQQPGAYDDKSAHLAQTLADQVAVAIHKTRLLDDLQHANLELRQLDKLKNQFIQNVAHELRTPLTLVRGYVELLAQGNLDAATQYQAINTAFNHTKNLVQLVEGITTLQDLRLAELILEPVNPSALVETALQVTRQKAIRANINLQADYPPDLPPLSGDFVWLSQALYQLLDNAIKFSPDGGEVILRLRAVPDQNELQIEVEDQGIGIPTEEQQHIFELFYQTDGTMTRRFSGTGLGLAIVQRVVQAHAGRVWVQSLKKEDNVEPRPGSKFIIRLPYLP